MSSASDDSNVARTATRWANNRRITDPPALPDAAPFQLLENRRRRYLLYCLIDCDGEASLSNAVDTVTAWESDCPVEEIRSTDRRCVYSTLRRTHLPRLETEEVVTYDADSGIVALGSNAGEVTRWLGRDDERREWSRYYLAISGLAGVLLTTEFVAALPLLLPESGAHVMVALLFVALTAVVAYESPR